MAVARWVFMPGAAETEYITLSEAARRAGYASSSTLYTAAHADPPRLKTVRLAPRVVLTTQTWLDDYLATLGPNQRFRGKPKRAGAGDAD